MYTGAQWKGSEAPGRKHPGSQLKTLFFQDYCPPPDPTPARSNTYETKITLKTFSIQIKHSHTMFMKLISNPRLIVAAIFLKNMPRLTRLDATVVVTYRVIGRENTSLTQKNTQTNNMGTMFFWLLLSPIQVAVMRGFELKVACWFGVRWFGIRLYPSTGDHALTLPNCWESMKVTCFLSQEVVDGFPSVAERFQHSQVSTTLVAVQLGC